MNMGSSHARVPGRKSFAAGHRSGVALLKGICVLSNTAGSEAGSKRAGVAPLLEKVLSCPTLPSLPGVAVRVLELTRDRNVSMQSLAEAVRTDPALATKVLKTVNSSYYALSTPCPSITRAMSMLGLNTVKSIVLGFSLVDFTKALGGNSGAFDFTAYWRRAICSAAGARSLAKSVRRVDPEEAFVAALVADIGMLACLSALRDDYVRAMKAAGDDHDRLSVTERELLGFDHAEAGGQLAERWRLPAQLTCAIAYHHSPDRCQPAHADHVRCVVLGRLAAATLTVPDPKPKLAQLLRRSDEWFGLSRDDVKKLLETTSIDSMELSKVMDLRIGAAADVASITAQAHEQLVQQQMELQLESQQLKAANDALAIKSATDGLTGASNRAHFDAESLRLFAQCADANEPFSLIFFDGDRFKSVNDAHGHAAGDAVLKELANRARRATGPQGQLFRYGGEEFTIVLPKTDIANAAACAERVRAAIEATPVDLSGTGASVASLRVTISLGVSAWDPRSGEKPLLATVVQAADAAVYAAKRSGRNRVCICKPGCSPTTMSGAPVKNLEGGPGESAAPSPAPTPASGTPAPSPAASSGTSASAPPVRKPVHTAGSAGKRTIMLVEDDPLAAKLLELLFAKRSDYSLVVVPSAEKALELIATPGKPRPAAVLCDYYLPGLNGNDLAKALAANTGSEPIPVVIITAAPPEQIRKIEACSEAAGVFAKQELCTNFEATLGLVLGVVARFVRAA